MDYNKFNLLEFLNNKKDFSLKTFGPGQRSTGVVKHIRKELIEIEDAPEDLSEWVDVILLALDGAWRSGHSSEAIIQGLIDKQAKNEKRVWPDWRTMNVDEAITHVKENQIKNVDVRVDYDEHNYLIYHGAFCMAFPSWNEVVSYCEKHNLNPNKSHI